MSRRWADVAELVATQGLKGRLTVRPVRGLPFLLSEGLRVHFVPPTIDGPREAKVKEATHAGGHDWLVAFSGVKNLDTAEKLVGSHVIVERADLPEGFEEGASYATERIVGKDRLTTLMITHNMRDAIVHGNRLIMMYDGRVVLDIAGEEKKKLTLEDLLAKFGQATGSDEADDKLLLG